METRTIVRKVTKSLDVNLSVASDIDEALKKILPSIKNADESRKDYQNYLTNADKPFKKMIDARKSYLDATKNVTSLLNQAVKISAELGLNPEDVKGYRALQNNIDTGNEIVDTIDSFKSPSTFQ
jgi:hypothetical protein